MMRFKKMTSIIKRIINFIKRTDGVHRQKAIDDLQYEVQELKHIFALMTVGHFTGNSVVPLPITLELIPDMQEEMAILFTKVNTAHNPLSEQFSRLDAI